MDNPSINIKSKYCQKHNQPFQYFDKNGKNPQCEGCLLQKGELITFDQIQKQYQEEIINNNKVYDLQLQQLYTLKEGMLNSKESIIASLDKSIQQISDQIKSIQSQKQSIQQLDMIMNQYASIEDFTTYLKNNQKSNGQCLKQLVVNVLLDLKQKIRNIDFLDIILNWKKQLIQQTQVSQKNLIQEVILEKQNILNLEYELIQQVESKSFIYSFAIDQRTNTLVAGMRDGIIQIYDFQNGKVGIEKQILKAHIDSVFCLYCMKNTHSFVSGSSDSSIIIWRFDKINKWQVQQTWFSHIDIVACIIMNANEDLLISGSYDKTIKFWKKLNDFWNFSQTVDAGGTVYALSLNENENEHKLIASTSKNQIVVMIIQKNQEWKLVQTIQVNNYGLRLCFTIKNEFVFQSLHSDQLEVYDYDETKQQFYQKTKVKVQTVKYCNNIFPCQFIKSVNILAVKHGNFMNIFKVNQGGEYQLIKSIEYKHYIIYGKMSDNGQYLITWDYGSNEIQVRKLKFKCFDKILAKLKSQPKISILYSNLFPYQFNI